MGVDEEQRGDAGRPAMIRPHRRAAVAIGELLGEALGSACRKRGFAGADILAYWPEIVGEAFAETTEPDRIVWPRRRGGETGEGAVLHVRVEAGAAFAFQHAVPQVIDRLAAFLGWRAVGRIRIIQRPLRRARAKPLPPEPDPAAMERLEAALADIADDRLKSALSRLGRAVLAERQG